MFRKKPPRPVAIRSPEFRDIELKDDELEHVVGGLERSWTTRLEDHRGVQGRILDESARSRRLAYEVWRVAIHPSEALSTCRRTNGKPG